MFWNSKLRRDISFHFECFTFFTSSIYIYRWDLVCQSKFRQFPNIIFYATWRVSDDAASDQGSRFHNDQTRDQLRSKGPSSSYVVGPTLNHQVGQGWSRNNHPLPLLSISKSFFELYLGSFNAKSTVLFIFNQVAWSCN